MATSPPVPDDEPPEDADANERGPFNCPGTISLHNLDGGAAEVPDMDLPAIVPATVARQKLNVVHGDFP